jgi:diadenylate cyclase
MIEVVWLIDWSNVYQVMGFVLNLTMIFIVFGLLFFLFFSVIKRVSAYVFLSIAFILILASFLLGLDAAFVLISMISTSGIFISLFANFGNVKAFLSNPFRRGTAKNVSRKYVGKVFDRQRLYDIITTTVASLSKSKIGALITFEREYSLSDISKNGVAIDCPVSSEILMTIFYPGTRLHDGAVVIRGDTIVAASVFFTPSTKAYAGKYGSRHRAAIGISEISDAVTVVVSEETGRISIAVDGQLEPVQIDNFRRVFENYMSDKNKEEE